MDLKKIAEAGLNTIRVADPPQSVVREAGKLGIMVVPIIRDRLWARTILALREFPNILYWDIDTPDTKDLPGMLLAISTLDHYKRPIAYSGTLDPDFSKKPFSMIDIRGVSSQKKYTAACGSAPISGKINRVVVLTSWGAPPATHDKYAAVRSAPELIRTWKMCTGAGKTTGAFYANLYGPDTQTPALRDAVSMKWNDIMLDVMKSIFSEFETTAAKNSAGGVRMGFKYLGTPIAVGVKAYTPGAASKLIDKQNTLKKDQVFFVDMPGISDKLSSLALKYETNGGIPHEFKFDGGTAVFDPAAASFDSKDMSFKKNEQKQVRVKIDGNGIPCEADVSFASDTSGVNIEPQRRSVSIPASDSVLVPFSITAPATRAPFLITCVIKFTDIPRPAIKVYAVTDTE